MAFWSLSMTHHGPQVGGVRFLVPWSLRVTACVMWLRMLHDTCMFETSGKVLRVCANALTSSPPASKRSRWSPHFIILHGPCDVQGASHASKHTPCTCWEPLFFGGYQRGPPIFHCASVTFVKPGSGLRECSQVVWMRAGLAGFVGVKAA